ncbi:MAG: nucleoside monophosphate kinase [Bacteriovoracaceae bacterium]|nr:nucleoside monophosphate kinase [Bacteriovoracaceae bacterium]
MKPQLILLGAPGSGKGTQAARLVAELHYNHISTGDLLRKEIKSESELGKKVQGIMNSGKLVDDNTVLELLNANCDLSQNAYIFDGFPRNHDQAKALDEVVLKKSKSRAVYFNIDLEKLAARLTNRRTCSGCGEIFNLLSKAPAKEGVCDLCGKSLTQRKDDNEETVKTRLQVFKETIDPVLAHYEESGRLARIDASQNPDDVFAALKGLTEE